MACQRPQCPRDCLFRFAGMRWPADGPLVMCQIWEIPTGAPVLCFQLPASRPSSTLACWTPDSKFLCLSPAGPDAHGVRIHEVSTGEYLTQVTCAMPVQMVRWLPAGSSMLVQTESDVQMFSFVAAVQ